MYEAERVLKAIRIIADRLLFHGKMLNERYVHHCFSRFMQEASEANNLLDVFGPTDQIRLHPEWPTYKEATNILFGRYRKIGKRYFPADDNRKGGFLDFAIGDYARPEIGVEMTLKSSWHTEETVYDFMKLLDNRNSCFRDVVSFGVILRENGLPGDSLGESANAAYAEAVERLSHRCCDSTRIRHFIFTELAPQARRHWQFSVQEGRFLIVEHIGVPT